MYALLVLYSVRSLSKIEFSAFKKRAKKYHRSIAAPAASRKRVQRYGLFPNWQNLSATFFKKNEIRQLSGCPMHQNDLKGNPFRIIWTLKHACSVYEKFLSCLIKGMTTFLMTFSVSWCSPSKRMTWSAR